MIKLEQPTFKIERIIFSIHDEIMRIAGEVEAIDIAPPPELKAAEIAVDNLLNLISKLHPYAAIAMELINIGRTIKKVWDIGSPEAYVSMVKNASKKHFLQCLMHLQRAKEAKNTGKNEMEKAWQMTSMHHFNQAVLLFELLASLRRGSLDITEPKLAEFRIIYKQWEALKNSVYSTELLTGVVQPEKWF